jgi:hypothetical protein
MFALFKSAQNPQFFHQVWPIYKKKFIQEGYFFILDTITTVLKKRGSSYREISLLKVSLSKLLDTCW